VKVIVKNYDPKWPVDFKNESTQLYRVLKDLVNKIYHIGSTAVPGLMAKPIIDIMLDVSDLDLLDDKAIDMEQMGYEVMGEFGIKGRRYYRKGGDNRTHQIHAFKAGYQNLMRHIAFRDYLIEHSNIAKKYGQLKLRISKTCNHDIGKYSDEKDPFIKLYEMKAINWFASKS